MRSFTFARSLVALVTAMVLGGEVWGIDYYWNGTGAVNSTASWNTAIDGSGTAPTNFTTANQIFNIQSGQSATLGGTWAISGTGSRLAVQTGGAFTTGSNNPTFTANLSSGATYTFTGTSYGGLTLGTIDPNSTFIFGGSSGFASTKVFGNFVNQASFTLNFAGTYSTLGNLQQSSANELRLTANSTATTTIGRDLIVDATRTLNFTSGTGNVTINISQNLTNSGTISKTGSGSATVAFIGAGNSGTATWGTFGTASTATTVTIATDRTVTFADSYQTSGTRGITNNGTLNIGSGATLSGTGSILNTNATVTVLSGGTVRGDSGTGTGLLAFQNTGTVTVNSGGSILANIGASGTNSSIDLSGNILNLATGAKLSLQVLAGFTNTGTRSYNIATLSDGANLQLDGASQANNFVFGKYVQGTGASGAVAIDLSGFTLSSGDTFTLQRTGNNLVLNFQPVPEPATVLAIGAAGLGVVSWVRRRRKAATATTK